MTTTPEVNASFDSEPSIVSVNSRGATSNGLARKFIAVAVMLGVVIVLAVFGINKYRANQKAKDGESAALSKVENKPAQVGPKRDFGSAPPAQQVAVAKPVVPIDPTNSQSNPSCKDIVVTSADGKPLMNASGQPIRVGCDGKLVPAINPQATPPAGSGATQTANGTPAPKPLDRFAGDVLLQSQGPIGQQGQVGGPAKPMSQQDSMNMLRQLMQPQQQQQPPQGQGVPPDVTGQPQGRTNPSAPTSIVAQAMSGIIGTAQAQGIPVAPPQQGGTVPNQQGNIGGLLTPTLTPKVQAAKIGDRNMIITKGTQLDCAMTVKLVNEVSGFASCVTTSNIYSTNGKVLLLERGSDLQGEYGATIQQGQRRIFVLWERAVTPNGVIISLASPAADGLGTMGLNGYVDNRWWDRLGAAFLLSFVKDAIAFKIAESSTGSAGGVVYQNTARTGEAMAERVLASTINIKPTIYKNQGDRASVYVARDLDFSSVYALRNN